MKLKSSAALAVICMSFAGAANANMLFDIYAGAAAGLGRHVLFNGDDHKNANTQSYAGVLGIDIPLFRLEAEYNYLLNDKDSMQTAMANAYLKMPTPVIQPYIGAGAGILFAGTLEDISVKKTAAYQGMLGLTIKIPLAPLHVDVEGRAIYVPKVLDIDDAPNFLNYEGRVKLRYIF